MGMLLHRHRNRHDDATDQDASTGDGKPSTSWTNPQLIEYAKAHGISLDGATKKAEYLERIEAAAQADSADQGSADDGDSTSEGEDTPADPDAESSDN